MLGNKIQQSEGKSMACQGGPLRRYLSRDLKHERLEMSSSGDRVPRLRTQLVKCPEVGACLWGSRDGKGANVAGVDR